MSVRTARWRGSQLTNIGSNCPHCDVDIGQRAVVRAIWPSRIFCPHCRARVEYRDTKLVYLLAFLLAGGGVAAVLYAALWLDNWLLELPVLIVLAFLVLYPNEIATARFLRKHKQLRLLAEPPADGRPRRRYLFSLKSLLVMQLVLVGFLWANTARTYYGPSENPGMASRGWPFKFESTHISPSQGKAALEEIQEHHRRVKLLGPEFRPLEIRITCRGIEFTRRFMSLLGVDILLALVVSVLASLASELLLFRRKRDSGA